MKKKKSTKAPHAAPDPDATMKELTVKIGSGLAAEIEQLADEIDRDLGQTFSGFAVAWFADIHARSESHRPRPLFEFGLPIDNRAAHRALLALFRKEHAVNEERRVRLALLEGNVLDKADQKILDGIRHEAERIRSATADSRLMELEVADMRHRFSCIPAGMDDFLIRGWRDMLREGKATEEQFRAFCETWRLEPEAGAEDKR